MTIGFFGSTARGEAREESDVVIVLRIREPDLFMLVGIKEELEERLLRPVDIVNKHWASHLPGKNPGNSHLYQTTIT